MVSVHVSLAKAMAAITGNRMWPFYQDPNEYHMIRSRFLLGAIRDGVVYDAHDPSLPRFKCLKGKIEPFDGDDVWTKVSHPGQDEEVDYFLFSPGAVQEDESRERSRAAQGTRLCMMRIPAMNRYWVLFAGAGPRLNEAASPASPAGVLPHAPARAGQSQTSFMRKGLIFVVVAIVVALLCRATPEYEPPPVRRGPI